MPAPKIRDYAVQAMPTNHLAGDLLLIFAGSSNTTPPTLSSDWTVATTKSSSYSLTMGYKVSTGASTTTGTVTGAGQWEIVSIAGSSGFKNVGNYDYGIASNGILPIPALAAKDSALRLSWTYGIAGGGNPPFITPTITGGSKIVSKDYYYMFLQGGGTSSGQITDSSYGVGTATLLTVQILPPPPSNFLAMF